MNLNDFSSFFEIFAGLCFLYAGSESFRFAINDTLLELNKSMGAIKGNLEIRQAELLVAKSEENPIITKEKATALATDLVNVEKVTLDEVTLREFPEGFKSMFLITAMFCVAVLLVGGFAQFFFCSEITHWTLLCLDLVFLYNLFVFIKSFFKNRCSTNLKLRYPLAFISTLIFISVALVNFLPYVAEHCKTHGNQDQATRFSPHSHIFINEKISIIIALFIAVSPFLLHFVRVFIHKFSFTKKYMKVGIKLDTELDVARKTETLLTTSK